MSALSLPLKWPLPLCSRVLLVVLLTLTGGAAARESYVDRPEVAAFIDAMVAEHRFDGEALRALFADVRRQDRILETIARPAEKRLTWGEYRRIFLGEERIAGGVAFWERHEQTLARAHAELGVPPELVVAVIGVETYYGRHRGSWRVLDALTTLGFDYPPRAAFFRRELEEFLLLTREERRPATEVLGSYAGAMGFGQFIPSSYRAYAVDFDGDGVRDIWDDPVDAIGSVANYFHRHGWRDGEGIRRILGGDAEALGVLATPGLDPDVTVAALRERGVGGLDGLSALAQAKVHAFEGDAGGLHVAGLHNFWVITRYNRSPLYAMAVTDLAEAVAARRSAADG